MGFEQIITALLFLAEKAPEIAHEVEVITKALKEGRDLTKEERDVIMAKETAAVERLRGKE